MAKLKSDPNSVDGALRAMQNAIAGVFAPPIEANLTKDETPYWNAIVRARAREEWDENTLQVAAQLARVRAKLQRNEEMVASEGEILTNERGTPVCNPRIRIISDLMQQQNTLMRSLQIHAVATAGHKTDLIAARKAEKKAQSALSDADDLLN